MATTDPDETPELCRQCGGPGPLESQRVSAGQDWAMCRSCRAAFGATRRMGQVRKPTKPWRLKGKEDPHG